MSPPSLLGRRRLVARSCAPPSAAGRWPVGSGILRSRRSAGPGAGSRSPAPAGCGLPFSAAYGRLPWDHLANLSPPVAGGRHRPLHSAVNASRIHRETPPVLGLLGTQVGDASPGQEGSSVPNAAAAWAASVPDRTPSLPEAAALGTEL